jgi:hypothetical protein
VPDNRQLSEKGIAHGSLNPTENPLINTGSFVQTIGPALGLGHMARWTLTASQAHVVTQAQTLLEG